VVVESGESLIGSIDDKRIRIDVKCRINDPVEKGRSLRALGLVVSLTRNCSPMHPGCRRARPLWR
jgi:hypothetical protein